MPEGSLRCYSQDTTYLHQTGALTGLAFTKLARVAGHGAHRTTQFSLTRTRVTSSFCSCYLRSGDLTQLGSHKTRTFLTDWAFPLVSNLPFIFKKIFITACVHACKPKPKLSKSVLSFHLCVGLGNWAQFIKLLQQSLLPTDPAHWPHHPLFENNKKHPKEERH